MCVSKTDTEDVTNQLSKLTTDLKMMDKFLNLIESLVSVSGYLYEYPEWSDIGSNEDDRRRARRLTTSDLVTRDLLSLIEAGLYISDLARISVSIPTESYTFNLTNFAVYVARVTNSTINTTLWSGNTSVTVIIGSDDTDDGRDSFELIDDSLNSVDVMILSIGTPIGSQVDWTGEDTADNGCNNNIQSSNNNDNTTSYIVSDEVTVTVLSGNSSSSIHNLSSIVTIIFENLDIEWNNGEETQLCVGYATDDDSWSTKGCTTTVDNEESTITCICNHLTKFAILSTVSQGPGSDGCKDGGLEDPDMFEILDYIIYFCSLFIACLFGVLICIVYKCWMVWKMNLLAKYKEKKDAFNGIAYAGACAFFEIIGCIMVSVYSVNDSVTTNEVYIETLTIVLGLPLLFYFLMFTQALHGWVIVARSIDNRVNGHEERNKLIFDFIKWTVISMFLTLVILMVFDVESKYGNLFLLCEILWLTVMCIACTLFTFYSLKLRDVLSSTLRRVYHAHDKRQVMEQKKIIKRLTVVSILLSSFFLVQTCIALYGVYIQITSLNYDISLTVVDLFLNIVYLCTFLYLYIPSVNRAIEEEQESFVLYICYQHLFFCFDN